MRVAIITESFLPEVNGVVNSVLRVLDHLVDHGHDVLLLAPEAPGAPTDYRGVPIVPMASLAFPGYQQVRICTTPQLALEWTLASFSPDVVHLASPINVGYRGALAARRLGIPSVAVYQTDVPGYASRYGISALEAYLWARVRGTHQAATLNLAPSSASIAQLEGLGVGLVAVLGARHVIITPPPFLTDVIKLRYSMRYDKHLGRSTIRVGPLHLFRAGEGRGILSRLPTAQGPPRRIRAQVRVRQLSLVCRLGCTRLPLRQPRTAPLLGRAPAQVVRRVRRRDGCS